MQKLILIFISIFILGSAHRDNDDPGLSLGPKLTRQFSENEAKLAMATLKRFLSEFKEIRVFMTSAPGYGHQVATINVMRRMRSLGFKGHFEVIYAEDLPGSAEKLEHLIPGFRAHQNIIQHLSTQELGSLSIISDKYSSPYVARRKIFLGVSGASDSYFAPQAFKEEKFNVEVFLQLQPTEWGGLGKTEDISFKTGSRKSLSFLNGLNMVVPLSDRLTRQEIASLRGNPIFGPKVDGLIFLFSLLGDIDLWPAYGIDINNQTELELRLAILAYKRAKELQPKLFNKPLLIPIMAEFGVDKVNPAKEFSRLGVPYVTISDLRERGLEAFGQSSVVAVQVGALPPKIFDFLFTKATLPALLEGKNLQNLMLSHGLPYLNILGHRGAALNIGAAPEKVKNTIDSAFGVFAAFKTLNEHELKAMIQQPANIEKVAQFLVESRKSLDFQGFFFSKRISPSSPQNDKIAQAFLVLEDVIKEMNLSVEPSHGYCKSLFSNI